MSPPTYHFPIRRGRGWYSLFGQNVVLPSLGTKHFPIRGAKGCHSLFGQNVVLPSLGTNHFIMRGEKEMAFRVRREFYFRLLVDE